MGYRQILKILKNTKVLISPIPKLLVLALLKIENDSYIFLIQTNKNNYSE